ncbi:MAG: thioredoxin family protein [Desulfovibrio sp.]|jgi:thiol:disulfide interchange protein DsbD|nr:thioredoxin family protein [Desulfovibrio sp.]
MSRLFHKTQRARPNLSGFLALLVFMCFYSASACAAVTPVKVQFAGDGAENVAAVAVSLPPGYHAYAHEPGDAGRPAMLKFALEGTRPLPVRYPAGAMQRDFYDPAATVFVYEDEAIFFVSLPEDAAGKSFTAEVSLLLCSKKNCEPLNQTVKGVIPANAPLLTDMRWNDRWRELKGSLADGAPANGRPDSAELADDPVRLKPRYAGDIFEVAGLGKALLIGILAGLLLNAMPCVLPVLTFKISGLLLLGGGESKKRLRRFRAYNLFFAAGIMTLFTVLALALGFADMMWGQMYQNQALLFGMLLIVFLMGLSMLGVFTLPVIDLKLGVKTNNPHLQAYTTGLVSTFLATPCSGPLLGGVLGWAFSQPLPILVAVFWAVGLGMALPYLLLCVWPEMVKIFPRPGQWMQVFERVTGFLLLGTSLYLLSILPEGKHVKVLCALLLLSFCVWFWSRYCGTVASVIRRCAVGLLFGGALLAVFVWALRPVEPPPQWRAFSQEYFMSQLGKKPLLLEFTADWCPNCKVLEATVLTGKRMRFWQSRYGVDFVRVDLTGENVQAMRLLETLGSKSIPLTALFPAGDGAFAPLVLRDVYGVRSLERGMREAFGLE